MGEEARTTDYPRLAHGGGDRGRNGMVDVDDGCKDRVIEWEHGLPDCVDLTPLCQALVPPELASAFSITPEPSRTVGDVALASRSTLSNLGGGVGIGASSQAFSTTNNHDFGVLDGGEYGRDDDEEEVVEDEEAEDMIVDRLDDNDGGKKLLRKSDLAEEADSVTDGSKAAKRPRLVWTPQLHKRFVDVVSHLGIKNAVPKTIMQLMNVEGLTRENVASHLQKYRLYLKRMQRGGGSSMIGNSDSGGMGMAGSSATDQLFASTPVTPHGMNNENGSGGGVGGSGGHAHAHRHNGTYGSYGNGDVGNGHMPMPMMMGYGVPGGMVGMPVYGMYGGGHPAVPMDGNHHHHQYGPMVPHPPQSGASNDK